MAKDIFHQNVRDALEKEGWLVTADPLKIDLTETYIDIDLAAEMVIVAERAGEKLPWKSRVFWVAP